MAAHSFSIGCPNATHIVNAQSLTHGKEVNGAPKMFHPESMLLSPGYFIQILSVKMNSHDLLHSLKQNSRGAIKNSPEIHIAVMFRHAEEVIVFSRPCDLHASAIMHSQRETATKYRYSPNVCFWFSAWLD